MTKKKYSNKRDRFIDLAEKRTNAVIKRLDILGNCSNKNLYEYSPSEVDKIFREINKKVKETKSKFRTKDNNNEFKL